MPFSHMFLQHTYHSAAIPIFEVHTESLSDQAPTETSTANGVDADIRVATSAAPISVAEKKLTAPQIAAYIQRQCLMLQGEFIHPTTTCVDYLAMSKSKEFQSYKKITVWYLMALLVML